MAAWMGRINEQESNVDKHEIRTLCHRLQSRGGVGSRGFPVTDLSLT